MKGKNPTRFQRKILEKSRLNPSNWLILKNPTGELVIQNKITGKIRTVSE